jgi:predicted alpha/beta superfamily hydrolase
VATEILLNKPQLFTHYFIISPSLWWDDESLYNNAAKLISQQKDDERFVYISVGKQGTSDDGKRSGRIISDS